jgi:hypothetical protein
MSNGPWRLSSGRPTRTRTGPVLGVDLRCLGVRSRGRPDCQDGRDHHRGDDHSRKLSEARQVPSTRFNRRLPRTVRPRPPGSPHRPRARYRQSGLARRMARSPRRPRPGQGPDVRSLPDVDEGERLWKQTQSLWSTAWSANYQAMGLSASQRYVPGAHRPDRHIAGRGRAVWTQRHHGRHALPSSMRLGTWPAYANTVSSGPAGRGRWRCPRTGTPRRCVRPSTVLSCCTGRRRSGRSVR